MFRSGYTQERSGASTSLLLKSIQESIWPCTTGAVEDREAAFSRHQPDISHGEGAGSVFSLYVPPQPGWSRTGRGPQGGRRSERWSCSRRSHPPASRGSEPETRKRIKQCAMAMRRLALQNFTTEPADRQQPRSAEPARAHKWAKIAPHLGERVELDELVGLVGDAELELRQLDLHLVDLGRDEGLEGILVVRVGVELLQPWCGGHSAVSRRQAGNQDGKQGITERESAKGQERTSAIFTAAPVAKEGERAAAERSGRRPVIPSSSSPGHDGFLRDRDEASHEPRSSAETDPPHQSGGRSSRGSRRRQFLFLFNRGQNIRQGLLSLRGSRSA